MEFLRSHPRTTSILILALFVVTAFALYAPAINGPFLFDDEPNILRSPAVRMNELSLAALGIAAREGLMPSRPLANISFALNYLAHQDETAGYHAVNIVIHAVTGFLLFLLLQVTLQINARAAAEKASLLIPLTAAGLWFLHPVQTQAVAYIVQRMTSMAAMFYLLAMLCYVYGRRAAGLRRKTALFSGTALAGLAAMACKETGATLPVFIFLYEWYFFQDLSTAWLKKRSLLIIAAAGGFAASAFVFLGNDPVGRILGGYQIRSFSLGERLLTELRVVVFYLGQLLYPAPSRLSLEHNFPLSESLFAPPATILAALFLAALLVLAVRLAGKHRLISFAILWYLGNLLIESSVIGLEIAFEHRNYLPSMFVVTALVILGDRLIRPPQAKIALALTVALLFAFWTHERSRVWSSEELLIRDSLAKAPGSFRMNYNLGTVLSRQGSYDEAIAYYYRALRVYPQDRNARRALDLNAVYTNLGNSLSRKGRLDEADRAYRQALLFNPRDGNAYLGLGNNLVGRDDLKGAAGEFRKALLTAADPGVIFLSRCALGLIARRLGRKEEALSHYRAALRVQPGSRQAQDAVIELQRGEWTAKP